MITVYELIYNFLFIRKTIYHILHYSKNNRFCVSLCSICLSLLLPLVQNIANCCFFLAWLLNWENKLQLSFQASDLSIVVKAFYFQALISTFCKDKTTFKLLFPVAKEMPSRNIFLRMLPFIVNHIFSNFYVKTNVFCTVLYLELFGKLWVDMLWSYSSLHTKNFNLCHKKSALLFWAD